MTLDEAPRTMTARSPEDLIALAGVLLGFDPHESVTLLTFGGDRPMHARLDLPPPSAPVEEVVDLLVRPALQHGVPRVVLLVHSTRPRVAGRWARALRDGFTAQGIDVADAIRADGSRWYGALPGDPRRVGTPYDVTHHPFRVDAVLRGQVVHRSRDELAASLDPRPELVAGVQAATVPQRTPGSRSAWLAAEVARAIAGDGTAPGPDVVAALLVALRDPGAVEQVWSGMDRRRAAGHVRLWTAVLTSAPEPLRAAPAALLAFAAWLTGNGALSWCALDAVGSPPRESEHGRLAACVLSALEQAVPPSAWDATGDRPRSA